MQRKAESRIDDQNLEIEFLRAQSEQPASYSPVFSVDFLCVLWVKSYFSVLCTASAALC